MVRLYTKTGPAALCFYETLQPRSTLEVEMSKTRTLLRREAPLESTTGSDAARTRVIVSRSALQSQHHVWSMFGTFPSQQIFQSEICCLDPGTKLLQTDLPFGLNLQCITCIISYSEVMWSHCFRNNCTHCHMPPGSAALTMERLGHPPLPRLLTWQVDALWAPAGGENPVISALQIRGEEISTADSKTHSTAHAKKSIENSCRMCKCMYSTHACVCIPMLSSHIPSLVQTHQTYVLLCFVSQYVFCSCYIQQQYMYDIV